MRKRVIGLLLVFVALSVDVGWTANLIQDHVGTPLVFRDAGQVDPATTVQLTLRNLATLTGRVSNQVDRGTVFTPYFSYVCKFDYNGAYTMGQMTELWVAPANAYGVAGQVGAVDAILSAGSFERRNALLPIGVCPVNQTTPTTGLTCAGSARIPFQRWSLLVWNGTSLPLEDTDAGSWCEFTPYSPEVQD